jgi:hypothetical protein
MKPSEIILEQMVTHLIDMCKEYLQLDELPEIHLIDDNATVGGGSSFGEFTDDGIEVVTTNRHPMDVMRTIAHELVHYSQRVKGQEMDGSDGSETENQANAGAGIIMRRFGKEYPECFTL